MTQRPRQHHAPADTWRYICRYHSLHLQCGNGHQAKSLQVTLRHPTIIASSTHHHVDMLGLHVVLMVQNTCPLPV